MPCVFLLLSCLCRSLLWKRITASRAVPESSVWPCRPFPSARSHFLTKERDVLLPLVGASVTLEFVAPRRLSRSLRARKWPRL